MSQPIFRKAVTLPLLQDLLEQDVLSRSTFDLAVKHLAKPRWQEWLQQMLLLLGTTLFLAGVVFFFAYNWADIAPYYKFTVIEVAILIFAGLSHHLTVKKLSGQAMLSGCVVLIGVLMAVFGQVYQTGADSYELFAGWAILSLGLVIYGRFSGLWLIWLGIATTGLLFYWEQVAYPTYDLSFQHTIPILTGLYGTALAVSETGFNRGWDWLQKRWLPPILLTAIFSILSIPVFDLIFSFTSSRSTLTLFTAGLWPVAIGTTYIWYRYKQPDFLALFLMATTVCVVTITLVSRFLFISVFDSHIDEGIFLLTGMIILACVGTTAIWLKYIHRTMEN